MNRDFLNIELSSDEISKISMLGLAHIGDGVYELMVRTWLCTTGKATSGGLHKAAVKLVSARAQAEAVKLISPSLRDDEAAVYKRGRNSRVNSVPGGASIGEYHAATGFEALFGWLYLRGETKRLNELFKIIIDSTGE